VNLAELGLPLAGPVSNQGIGGLVQIGLILASLTVGHMGQLRPRIVSVSLPGQLGKFVGAGENARTNSESDGRDDEVILRAPRSLEFSSASSGEGHCRPAPSADAPRTMA
jgi:hypothetical protein